MAIETRIVNDSFTEIYVGGGNYLTQAAPTNFHRFYTRKILTDGESADDFREVTAAEKAALEASDAAWVRPPQSFIDRWNSACKPFDTSYGGFDESTGYFNCCGVTGIDYAEALIIDRQSSTFISGTYAHGQYYAGTGVSYRAMQPRVLLPIVIPANEISAADYMFRGCNKLEAVAIIGGYTDRIHILGNVNYMFYACRSLKRIYGDLDLRAVTDTTFKDCTALEEICVYNFSNGFSLADSPNLSAASIRNLARPRINTKPATVILHPEAYTRVTEEISALAAEHNITFATTE